MVRELYRVGRYPVASRGEGGEGDRLWGVGRPASYPGASFEGSVKGVG
jgi:hypothetical protein